MSSNVHECYLNNTKINKAEYITTNNYKRFKLHYVQSGW